MESLRRRLADPAPFLMDGGMGTLLRAPEGPADHPEFLNLSRPTQVVQLHRRYLEAGVSLLFTNTFGGNRLRLADSGRSFQLALINRQGVRLARLAMESVGRIEAGLVAGDIGPSGLPLPLVEESAPLVGDVFREQAECLVEAGVDLLVLETFTTLREAAIALAAIREIAPGHPVMVLFSLGMDGATADGHSPESLAAAMESGGATMVGGNCGHGARHLLEHLPRFGTRLPLAAKPSAGLPHPDGTGTVYPEPPEEWSLLTSRMAAAGARLLGGCCGTTPEHLAALAARLSETFT